jgi:rhodanese-related sulfurtransferase
MKNFIPFAFLVLFVSFGACQPKNKTYYVSTPSDFEKIMASTVGQLIDVRTPSEFKDGHIEGAVNIDFLNENFDKEIQKLDKSKPVFIYCKVGGRSSKAGSKLFKMGFTPIYELSGGYDNWKK